MVKFVLLDLDDTIFDFNVVERQSILKTFEEIGLPATVENAVKYHEYNKACWKAFERGEMAKEDVLVKRFDMLFKDVGFEYDTAATRDVYEKYLGSCYHFIDGAVEMLESLYKRYDLYVVTNGVAKVQYNRLKISGVEGYFKGVFISEEIGYPKPYKQFFDIALNKIDNFDKEKAVIVGDSLTSDMKGGVEYGLKTCWFNRFKEQTELPVNATATTLQEIPDILEKM